MWSAETERIQLNFYFQSIINHKHILAKYHNHQEHTYNLENYKSTMLEQY